MVPDDGLRHRVGLRASRARGAGRHGGVRRQPYQRHGASLGSRRLHLRVVVDAGRHHGRVAHGTQPAGGALCRHLHLLRPSDQPAGMRGMGQHTRLHGEAQADDAAHRRQGMPRRPGPAVGQRCRPLHVDRLARRPLAGGTGAFRHHLRDPVALHRSGRR